MTNQDSKKPDKEGRDIQTHVDGGEDDISAATCSSLVRTVLGTISTECKLQCIDQVVRLCTKYPIRLSQFDLVSAKQQ